MTNTKDQKMRERFKKKFLVGGVDSSVQFKEEVRGRLPQEFLKFLNEEIAKAREELIRDFRAELKASLYQQREEMGKALRMKRHFADYCKEVVGYNQAVVEFDKKIDNYLKK